MSRINLPFQQPQSQFSFCKGPFFITRVLHVRGSNVQLNPLNKSNTSRPIDPKPLPVKTISRTDQTYSQTTIVTSVNRFSRIIYQTLGRNSLISIPLSAHDKKSSFKLSVLSPHDHSFKITHDRNKTSDWLNSTNTTQMETRSFMLG